MQCKSKRRYIFILWVVFMLAFIFFFNDALAIEKSEETGLSVRQGTEKQSKMDQAPIQVMQKISQAQMNGKYLFILFYETDNSDCDVMSRRLDEFVKNNGEKVELVKIDRKDPNNSTIVSSMRVQTAPIPLTLLKDPKGQVVNAFKTVASEEDLKYAFPSPKKEEAMSSLQDGKSLIICFTSKAMASVNRIEQSCEDANKKLEGKAAYIKVDVTDPKEMGFLKEMKISHDNPEPTTVVINSKRQISGTFKGEIKADDLVLAATKVVAGGCCPAGSGKSCEPPKTNKSCNP